MKFVQTFIRMSCFVTSMASGFAAAGPVDESVVAINVTKQAPDIAAPWRYQAAQESRFLGIAVEPGLILTTAFTVDNAADLEMQTFGGSARHELKIVFVDKEVNLALLAPAEPKSFPALTPMALADSLNINDEVQIYKPRDATQLIEIPGRFLEVGIYRAVTSSYTVISHLVKIQQSGMGWAEPVLRGGRLAGMSSGQDQNYVHVIPVEVIRHFLQDKHDKSYRGFPSLGVMLSPLESPDVRKMLKAEAYDYGIRVTFVTKNGTVDGKIQKDDVILDVDGKRISDTGFYQHPRWGRIHMKHILNEKFSGDQTTVKILRGGKVETVTVTLQRFTSNDTPIVIYRDENKEPHVIFGGLVLLEVSRAYFEQFGDDWRSNAPFDLLYTLDYENDPDPTGRKAVILAQVLADDFNRGYETLSHALVEEVNGQPVHDLGGLIKTLRDSPISRESKRYATFKLARDQGNVVLAYDGLADAHARIAKTYDISSIGSFFSAVDAK